MRTPGSARPLHSVAAAASTSSVTLGQLAAVAEGELLGDPETVITGVAEIDKASSGDITYAVNDSYLRQLKTAAAVIVPWSVTALDRPIIRARNPYWSFAQILKVFAPKNPCWNRAISPQAYVAKSAQIGKDVTIRPFAVIEDDVKIGDRCIIDAGVYVGHGTEMGEDCILHPRVTVAPRSVLGRAVEIQSGSVIGSDGYGYVPKDGQHHKIPQIGIVVLEDGVEIGAGVTIDRATVGRTVIGAGSKIDNLVQIGHNCEIGPRCLIVAQSGLSGSTKTGADCRFAGQTGTTGHLRLGNNCTVAARGVVNRDLPDNSFVSGFPAKPHNEEKRIQVAMRRLPELLKRLRSLEARLGVRGEREGESPGEP
jgi:UDP-3-O-[3-hydroxymyristoyl] glucosamine N-acyltransferase